MRVGELPLKKHLRFEPSSVLATTENTMTKVTYVIVEHCDGGWAYKLGAMSSGDVSNAQ